MNPFPSHSLNQDTNHSAKGSSPSLAAEVLALLDPQSGERILDVGCGNGDLTAAIADAGAIPTGIDLSGEWITRAKQQHPGLDFHVENACQYRSPIAYDAVFSRAALHWITDAESVARSIWLALREGGRFAAEFAGCGNVAIITTAIQEELEVRGYDWSGRLPWYLPTIGEYTSLLEQIGFRVRFAEHFDKHSPLKGGVGIRQWLTSFERYFFYDVSTAEKEAMYVSIEEKLKPRLYSEGQWMIDTSRLRVAAIKASC